MTAGQIAAPRRQVRTPLVAAALLATFALGLLAGLNVPRTIGHVAQAAAHIDVAALATNSSLAEVVNERHRARELRLADTAGIVALPTSSSLAEVVIERHRARELRLDQGHP